MAKTAKPRKPPKVADNKQADDKTKKIQIVSMTLDR